MARSVKNRIRLGTVFLFLLVMLSAGFSIYYLATLKSNSSNIIKANYESLEYGHSMLMSLDQMESGRPGMLDSFAEALDREKHNITEPGEGAIVMVMENSLNALRNGDTSYSQRLRLRTAVQTMLSVNMRAIQDKSSKAGSLAENALSYQVLIASVLFIIGFSFAYNFPSILTSPIRRLAEGIREIAAKNYRHRVHIQSRDEFGELANAFNDMAERLEYFENSNLSTIIFEKSRAEAVINSLKDASIGIGNNDIILFANEQALQLLGINNAVIGRPAQELAERNDLFRFLLEEKGSVPFKAVVDGRENYFVREVIDVPLEQASSRVIVVKNITSFKELDVAKTNFIATVSHELKTPLASSDFSLKLLADERVGMLSTEQKELINSLKDDNQRMLRILSELLNMAQVEAGKISLELRPVDPHSIVENARASVWNAAKEKQVRISIEMKEPLPQVLADEEKTIWVLTNLLSNAIKHSPGGSEIRLSVVAGGEGLNFSVHDRGTGIPSEFLPKLFDRFFRVPGSKSRGTGLGLAICKEFIEAQGGEIWAESELGKGSAFGFRLKVSNE